MALWDANHTTERVISPLYTISLSMDSWLFPKADFMSYFTWLQQNVFEIAGGQFFEF